MKLNNIRIYDNGGRSYDRYTVIYMDQPETRAGTYNSIGMSEGPFGHLGICQHSPAMPGPHLGKRIRWDELPEACQRAVMQDLEPQH